MVHFVWGRVVSVSCCSNVDTNVESGLSVLTTNVGAEISLLTTGVRVGLSLVTTGVGFVGVLVPPTIHHLLLMAVFVCLIDIPTYSMACQRLPS